MGKAIGYFRVPAAGAGAPVPAPAEVAIRTWCGNHGHQVVALMSDADRASDGLTIAMEAAVKASMLVVDSLDSLTHGGVAPAQVLEKLLAAGAQLVALQEHLDSATMGAEAARRAVGGSAVSAADVRITFTLADPASQAPKPAMPGSYGLPEVKSEPVSDEYAIPSLTLEEVDPSEAAVLAPPPMYGTEEDVGIVPGEEGENISTWSLDDGDDAAPADTPAGPSLTANQDDIDAMVMSRQDAISSAAATGAAPAGQSDIDFLFAMQAARKAREGAGAPTPAAPAAAAPSPAPPAAAAAPATTLVVPTTIVSAAAPAAPPATDPVNDGGMAGMLELGGPGSESVAEEITLDGLPGLDAGADGDEEAADTPQVFADAGPVEAPAEGQTSVDFMLAMKAVRKPAAGDDAAGDDLDLDMFGSDADLEEIPTQGFTDSGETVSPAENQADVDFLLATKKLRQLAPPVPPASTPAPEPEPAAELAAEPMEALPGLSGNETPEVVVPQSPYATSAPAVPQAPASAPAASASEDREGIERYLAQMPPEDGLGYKVPPRGSSRASSTPAAEAHSPVASDDSHLSAANPFEDLAREMAGEAAREMARELTRGTVLESGTRPTPPPQGGQQQVPGGVDVATPGTLTPAAGAGKAVREDPHGIHVPPPPAGVPRKPMDRRLDPLEQFLLREAPKSYSPLANVAGMSPDEDVPPGATASHVSASAAPAPAAKRSPAPENPGADGGGEGVALKPLQNASSHMVHGEIDLEIKSFTPMASLAKAVRDDAAKPQEKPAEPSGSAPAPVPVPVPVAPPPAAPAPFERPDAGATDGPRLDVASAIARARAEVQADMGIKPQPTHAPAQWLTSTPGPVGGPGQVAVEPARWDRRTRSGGGRVASEASEPVVMRRNSDYTPVADAAARHVAQGNFKKAIAIWDEFLAAAEGHNQGMALNAIGDIYVRQGLVTEAADRFQKAVEAFEKSGYYAKAVAALRKIHKITPQNKKIHLRMGEMAARCGRLGDAVDAYLRYARSMVDRGDIFAAQSIFDRIRILDPLNARHRLQLAAELRDFGFLDEAVSEILNATDILLAEGRHEEAQRHLLRMIDVMPTHTALQTALEKVARGDAVPAPESPVEGSIPCADPNLDTDEGSIWHRTIDSDGTPL